MNKKLFLVMTFLLIASMLVACGGQKPTGEGNSQKPDGGTEESQQPESTGDSDEESAGEKGAEPVEIKWATWENAYMANEMAEKFNKQNPDIKVVVQQAAWFGNTELAKWAASGEMPDVFAVENPFLGIQNGWLYDLKPFLDKETDPKFYDNFVETGTYNGKVYMLPSYIYVHGIIVNKSLLEANNIPVPGYDWTIDDYANILTSTTKDQTVGTNGITDLPKHIPPQMNDDLGWGCWDGSKYVLGDEWIHAVNFTKDLHDKNVALWQIEEGMQDPWVLEAGADQDAAVQAIKNKYKEKYGEEENYNIFLKGNVATWMEFSWGIFFEENEKYSGFDWDFYPFPVVEKGDVSRPGIVCDSIAMLANTEHPEAAYKFIKYLSFDPASFDDRVEVIDNYDPKTAKEKYPDLAEDQFPEYFSFSHIPAINDQTVRDKWCEYTKVKPGVKYIIDNLDTGYIDGFKYVPDFDTAYHKTIDKAMREQIFTGQKTAADLAAELEQKANEITQEAVELMGD